MKSISPRFFASRRFRVEWAAFSVAKTGNISEENEDAIIPQGQGGQGSLVPFICAISDGATTAVFSREWAQRLVKAYKSKNLKDNADLEALRRKWSTKPLANEIPWYLEEKMLQGAFASLLGLTIHRFHRWEAVAVGDSCLFQLRQGSLLTAFPMEHSEQFSNRPNLISSKESEVTQDKLGEQTTGTWQTGDYFLLMTDALAAWFLSEIEDGHSPWERLANITYNSADFVSFVDDLRKRRKISDDDTSLLSVRVVGPDNALAEH